ncbi:DMT family transporter [Vibrio sp. 1-Bac 57]|uniref:DMT family transporter n=1 Tax=uncultured Psychromonas sp. TaxID=173974 RepID=UPI0026298DDA|nr:DMT family transporter [uncultured Psychromonas sp.]
MNSYKKIDSKATMIITLICFVWGVQQVLLKMVSSDMSPVLQISLRSGIAAFLLIMVMFWRKDKLISKETWKPGVVAGLLFALEFFLVGEGLRYTTVSHMVIFLYSAPIFVALILHFKIVSERLNRLQWIGIGSAFSGIALSFLWKSEVADAKVINDMLWGDVLAVLAALSWAVTTVLVRTSNLSSAPATQTLLYQLMIGFIVILIAAIMTNQTHFTLTTSTVSNLIFQGVIVSFGSLLLWFWLLRNYATSELGVFTFMTPMFGICLGVMILNEPLELSFIFGAILVIFGIFLVNNHQLIQKKLAIILKN